MKIGIDLDATITVYPAVFSGLTAALKKAGHEVHIITDQAEKNEQNVAVMLAEMNIA